MQFFAACFFSLIVLTVGQQTLPKYVFFQWSASGQVTYMTDQNRTPQPVSQYQLIYVQPFATIVTSTSAQFAPVNYCFSNTADHNGNSGPPATFGQSIGCSTCLSASQFISSGYSQGTIIGNNCNIIACMDLGNQYSPGSQSITMGDIGSNLNIQVAGVYGNIRRPNNAQPIPGYLTWNVISATPS